MQSFVFFFIFRNLSYEIFHGAPNFQDLIWQTDWVQFCFQFFVLMASWRSEQNCELRVYCTKEVGTECQGMEGGWKYGYWVMSCL